MKKLKISLRPQAESDLFGLYEYIRSKAGHAIAGDYIDRIEAVCMALETFPERGTRRDDIRPGLRILSFEKRAAILFRVGKAEVVIVRILYGGQDIERALRGRSAR